MSFAIEPCLERAMPASRHYKPLSARDAIELEADTIWLEIQEEAELAEIRRIYGDKASRTMRLSVLANY